jgi:LacI family transcriptional regulator
MTTIYDVAKIAGVSPKTVSRVINQPHSVTIEKRKRVTDAIKELDFHPNAVAASLKKQRTNIVGFVIPYGSDFVFQDPNMVEQIRGAHDLLSQEGYEILISAPVFKKGITDLISQLVKCRGVDGVIFYPSPGIDDIINDFNRKNFNFNYVSLGQCFEKQRMNFVDVSLTAGAYAATKYLISLGHCCIGVINKPSNYFFLGKDDLLRGYKAALGESGITYRNALVVEGDFTFESGYRGFQKLRKLNPALSAVICASDNMTYGVVKAITDAGLEVNRDVEVISGDNMPLTHKLYPFVSSIHYPSYEQGKEAGKMIATIISSGVEVPGITLHTEFVVRGKKI